MKGNTNIKYYTRILDILFFIKYNILINKVRVHSLNIRICIYIIYAEFIFI